MNNPSGLERFMRVCSIAGELLQRVRPRSRGLCFTLETPGAIYATISHATYGHQHNIGRLCLDCEIDWPAASSDFCHGHR